MPHSRRRRFVQQPVGALPATAPPVRGEVAGAGLGVWIRATLQLRLAATKGAAIATLSVCNPFRNTLIDYFKGQNYFPVSSSTAAIRSVMSLM
jgi:hypothetical protein